MSEQQPRKRKRPFDRKHVINAPSDLHDYELEQWNVLNEFEEKAWSESNKGLSTGWDGIDEALEGLQTGFHLVGGDSNIGKCLVEDSLVMDVSTGRLQTIKEIYEKQEIQLFTLNKHLRLQQTQPCAFVDDGIKPVYRLMTRLGREIETTTSHPYLTMDGWKKLMELKIGEHIAVPRSLPVFGNEKISDAEAKLIGYLISDGTTIDKVAFTNDNPTSIEDFKNAVKDFNCDLVVSEYNSNKTRCSTFGVHYKERNKDKNTLLNKVREWGMNKLAIEKELPEIAFMIPKNKMKTMLSRMFDCDGSVYETNVDGRQDVLVIEYASSSKKLIYQVQHLLLRFGILSQIREKQIKYKNEYNQSWSLEIRDSENIVRFIDEIGFYAKQAKANEIYHKAIRRKKKGANKDIVPSMVWNKVKQIKDQSGKSWSCVGKVMGYEGRNAKDIPHNYVKNNRNAQRKTLEQFAIGLESPALMDIATSDVYWDEVIAIEYVGEKQVYDLTIPETHNFIANDICVHNTSFMSQMAYNVATQNNDAYVIDFSLDDPMLDKISRVIAAGSKVIINAVKNPKNYKKYPNMLKRRSAGLAQLRKMVNCYKAYDQNHGTDVEQIHETIKRHIVELKQAGEKRKVVVFIDNFHDLTTQAREAQGNDKNKYDYLAQYVSDMATQLDIPIVCSAEFKKLNGFRRPSIDDIRESVKIKYEAKSVMLCYNEVSLKGEGASVYFEKAGDPAKQPVYEVKFAKNKYSKFKGRVYFEGYPEMAYFVEADEESTKRYNNVIYSNE